MGKGIIAITMGDPAGIGPEIIIKALSSKRLKGDCIPVIVGDLSFLDKIKAVLGINLHLIEIKDPEEIKIVDKLKEDQLLVYNCGYIYDVEDIKPGDTSEISGRVSYGYIKKATELALNGYVSALVTAPINKESIKLAGIKEAGHTEILASLTDSKNTITMFSVDRLKVFFHTRHVSLREAIESLNIEGVYNSILKSYNSLKSIGVKNPKLALSALNPHASDGGLFGNEEKDILIPACGKARDAGINIDGPVPADSVFHLCLEGLYDAVISLYHDQGHIATKTYDFYRTVSITLGLPFIRTSVDHGTAFNIAWKGIANCESMIEAVNVACRYYKLYNPSLLY